MQDLCLCYCCHHLQMLSLEMVLYNGAEQNVLLLPDPFSQSGASGSGAHDCQNGRLCGCAHAVLLMQTGLLWWVTD